jgi:Kef-type K+ transport system membrane component KefB
MFFLMLLGKYLRYLHFPEVDFSMLLIGALAYATFAELMGLHFILGAFIAGMFFSRVPCMWVAMIGSNGRCPG